MSLPMPLEISFGDTVQVLDTPETQALGIADGRGSVFGHTTPSSTGIEVVGARSRDYGINVYFDELDRGVWLAEELLAFVDHGAGGVMTLDGVDKQWVRAADGSWLEFDTAPAARRPWWRFWR